MAGFSFGATVADRAPKGSIDLPRAWAYASARGDLLPDCGPRKTIPLKGQDESPLSLGRDWGFFCARRRAGDG
jgi:hypothetical protein